MTDFITYAKSLAASGKGFLHDYRTGTLEDFSGNGAAATPGGAVWEADSKGYQLQCRNGGLTVADQASLRCSSALSIVCFGSFARANITETLTYLLAKKDAVATDYALGFTDETALFFTIGATSSAIAFDGRGAQSIAVTVASGAAPKSYLDGVYEAAGASALTPTDAGTAFYIGEDDNNSGRLLNSPLSAVLVLPDVELSAAQIAELYRLYQLRSAAGRGAPQHPRWFVKEDRSRSGLVGHWASFDDGVDETAEGNDGTLSGTVTGAEGVYGNAFDFHGRGAGALTVAAASSINNLATKTVCAWIEPRSAGQSDGGVIVSKGWKIALAADATFAELRLKQAFSGDDGEWSYPLPAANRTYHVAVSYDSSNVANDPVFYINGAAVTPTEETTPTGTVDADTASNLIIGNEGSSALAFAGWIDDVRLYDEILSAAQVQAIYEEGGERPVELLPREREPVTLANSTGAPIGPWSVGAGEWALDDDGAARVLECASAGYVSTPSSQAFGAWRFRLQKADGSTSYVLFAANKRGAFGATGLNGYALVATAAEALKLITVTNGAEAVVIAQTASGFIAAGTTYEIEIVRNPLDGSFQAYIKGGAYSTWTPWGTGNTDTTYTSSSFFTADLDAADELSSVVFKPFGGALDPSGGAAGLEYPTITNDQSTLLTTSLSLACPAGNAVSILWGDGSSSPLTCDGAVKTLTKTYTVEGSYQVKVVGDVDEITTFICWYQSWLSGTYSEVIAGLVDVEKLHIWGCAFTGSAGDFSHLTSLTDLLYTRGANLLADGDMEAVGVAAWIAADCSIAKGTATPYTGLRYIRCTRTAATYGIFQIVLTNGKTYRMTGAVRCSTLASEVPRVIQASGTGIWTSSASADWEAFDFTFVSTGDRVLIWDSAGTAGAWVDWDALYISEVV